MYVLRITNFLQIIKLSFLISFWTKKLLRKKVEPNLFFYDTMHFSWFQLLLPLMPSETRPINLVGGQLHAKNNSDNSKTRWKTPWSWVHEISTYDLFFSQKKRENSSSENGRLYPLEILKSNIIMVTKKCVLK